MLCCKVNDVWVLLFEGVSVFIVKDDFGNVYGMFYVLIGDGLFDCELLDYVELIKCEVGELEGVDWIDLYGKCLECINIFLLQDCMVNLGVKFVEVFVILNG